VENTAARKTAVRVCQGQRGAW